MEIYIVDAFIAPDSSGGNAAGVVLLDSCFPDDAEMQNAAARAGFSETAFVLKTVSVKQSQPPCMI